MESLQWLGLVALGAALALGIPRLAPSPWTRSPIPERKFPFGCAGTLQRTIDGLFREQTKVLHFCGVRKE